MILSGSMINYISNSDELQHHSVQHHSDGSTVIIYIILSCCAYIGSWFPCCTPSVAERPFDGLQTACDDLPRPFPASFSLDVLRCGRPVVGSVETGRFPWIHATKYALPWWRDPTYPYMSESNDFVYDLRFRIAVELSIPLTSQKKHEEDHRIHGSRTLDSHLLPLRRFDPSGSLTRAASDSSSSQSSGPNPLLFQAPLEAPWSPVRVTLVGSVVAG